MNLQVNSSQTAISCPAVNQFMLCFLPNTLWRHQMETFPRYWPFVRGIHRSPVNSPHKGQWRWALVFSLIYAWIKGWVNNREACDLRWHRPHYDVTVMLPPNRPWYVYIQATTIDIYLTQNGAKFSVYSGHIRTNVLTHVIVIFTIISQFHTASYMSSAWWRHQKETFSALLALCEGIHRSPLNSPHKGQWRGALMFPLICAWTNGWANHRDDCDLWCHRAHYDVTVMEWGR